MPLLQVDKETFNRATLRARAVADGFKVNGGFAQSNFLHGHVLIGRSSISATEAVYEIEEDFLTDDEKKELP